MSFEEVGRVTPDFLNPPHPKTYSLPVAKLLQNLQETSTRKVLERMGALKDIELANQPWIIGHD